MISALSLLRFTALTATILITPVASAGDPSAQAAPGTLLRWHGEGTTSCTLLERTFPPMGDTCWFPIDLLLPESTMRLERQRNGRRETTTIRVGPYPYPVQELTVAPNTVHLSESDLARHRRESRRISALWSLETPRRFSLPLAPPLEPLSEGRSFGNRRIFNGEPRNPHGGCDFAASRGTAVHAAAAGTVRIAEEHFFAGNSVFIDHGDGLITMYFHLGRIDVAEGDEVRRSQVIGTVGSTGRATGAHLHLGVRWHGARINPMLLLGPPSAVASLE